MVSTLAVSKKNSAHGRLRQTLAGRLIEAFLRGELAGPWLVEQDLAGFFGVSRTPIREAIGELARLGLVEQHPNRGARLLPLGASELCELYAVRAVLEAEAVRRAVDHCDPMALATARKGAEGLLARKTRNPAWAEREIALDIAFHEMIGAACDNGRLSMEVARYYELVAVVRRLLGRQYAAQQRAVEEHLVILEAMEAGEGNTAAVAMQAHIEAAGEAAAERIFSPHA